MDKYILNGLKFSLGILIGLSVFFGLVFAVGFHSANEIVSGVFQGNYTITGNLNVTGNSYGTVPSGLIFQSNTANCPTGFNESLGAVTLIPQDEGTAIGNMTQIAGAGDQGLVNIFDGNKAQSNTQSAFLGSGLGFGTAGKNFGSGNKKRITGYKTWCSNNYGCNDLNPPNITVVTRLYVSNTGISLPDKVLLHEHTFNDVNTAQEKDHTAAGIDSNETYQYAWIEFETGSGNVYGVAEIELYSSTLNCIS